MGLETQPVPFWAFISNAIKVILAPDGQVPITWGSPPNCAGMIDRAVVRLPLLFFRGRARGGSV